MLSLHGPTYAATWPAPGKHGVCGDLRADLLVLTLIAQKKASPSRGTELERKSTVSTKDRVPSALLVATSSLLLVTSALLLVTRS